MPMRTACCPKGSGSISKPFSPRTAGSPARSAVLANDMVHNRDFLTDRPTTPQWDIVAGNPPYLRAANVPDLLRTGYSRHVPDYTRNDMLHSFLEQCSRTVRTAGRIGLVSADRWAAF
ncbi:Modification methylase PaeR7I (Adenine-specific methyltransferase PaeR7I) (M.PaeR7I) [Candidatus Burkholderia brachyanthoides]|nr:Modification methylase PaeR7I (Adenine-specific methyltransferase PaeR7I) (M.PaeR7I) [Candidatus Burkholderia brachyanthoides]